MQQVAHSHAINLMNFPLSFLFCCAVDPSEKGFVMEMPNEYQNAKQKQIVDDGCLLFIPSKSVCDSLCVHSHLHFVDLL